jgi:hypothetical protein
MLLSRLARLAAVAALIAAGAACTSSEKHDQFYGTDVGANWIPPDATVRDTAPSPEAGHADAGDAGDAGGDGGADGAVTPPADGPSADSPASDTL